MLSMALLIILIPIIIICLVALVIEIIGRWKFFEKAGRNGWESIIPFYSVWVYVEIAGLNYWDFFLVIAGILSMFIDNIQFITSPLRIIGLFFCNYNISKKLHKDNVFAVLMTLFSYIMIPLIGFSKSYEFDNNVIVSPNGPITDSSSNNTNNENTRYCSSCGTKININNKFCPNCGKEIQ